MNLDEILKQTPCGERLLAAIVKELNDIIDMTDNGQSDLFEPETYEVLYNLRDLGDKLLNEDYFAEAEAVLENCKGKDCFELIDKWCKKYTKCAKLKQKDYNKFFNILSNHIEEFC